MEAKKKEEGEDTFSERRMRGVLPVILCRVQPVKVKVRMDTFSGSESESEKGGFEEKLSCL